MKLCGYNPKCYMCSIIIIAHKTEHLLLGPRHLIGGCFLILLYTFGTCCEMLTSIISHAHTQIPYVTKSVTVQIKIHRYTGLGDVISVSPSSGVLPPHLNADSPSTQHIHLTFTPG